MAWRALALAESTHESRTRRNAAGGVATTGLVWDVHGFVSLGLEAGYEARSWDRPRRHLVWLGGSGTPLVTVHAPFLDLGLTGAMAWEDGEPGVLAGFRVQLTL